MKETVNYIESYKAEKENLLKFVKESHLQGGWNYAARNYAAELELRCRIGIMLQLNFWKKLCCRVGIMLQSETFGENWNWTLVGLPTLHELTKIFWPKFPSPLYFLTKVYVFKTNSLKILIGI